jgi:hypothetical protein
MSTDAERRYGVIKEWNGTSGTIDTAVGELSFDGSSCGRYRPAVGTKVTCTAVAAPRGPHAASVEPIPTR